VTSSVLSAMHCSVRCPFQNSCTKLEYAVDKWTVSPVSVARLIGRQEHVDTRGQVTGRRRTSIAFSQSVILLLRQKKGKTMHSEPLPQVGGRESVVGIATRCGLDDPRIGPQGPPILPYEYNGYRVLPGGKATEGLC
jgi:hypothetical protein